MKFFKNKALIVCSVLLSTSIILCSCGKEKASNFASDKSIAYDKNSELKSSASNGNTVGVAPNQASTTNNDTAKKDEKVSYENTQTSAMQDRKIVKSASLVIESTNFDKSVEALNEKLSKAGGYSENVNEAGSTVTDSKAFKNRNAKFILRIPNQNYEAFITDAGNIGNVINKIKTGEDITSQYFDTEAHLRALKTKEERLLELLKKTGELKDILTLETELNNTVYQIETLTGSLKKWDNMVQYSKVSVEIQEVEKLTEVKETPTTLLGKTKNAFIYSCKVILKFLKGFLIALFAILPFLPIFIILYFIIRFIYKRYKTKYTFNKNSNKN